MKSSLVSTEKVAPFIALKRCHAFQLVVELSFLFKSFQYDG
jgi:hypothetical protein